MDNLEDYGCAQALFDTTGTRRSAFALFRRYLLILIILTNANTDLGGPATLLFNDLGGRTPEPSLVTDLEQPIQAADQQPRQRIHVGRIQVETQLSVYPFDRYLGRAR